MNTPIDDLFSKYEPWEPQKLLKADSLNNHENVLALQTVILSRVQWNESCFGLHPFGNLEVSYDYDENKELVCIKIQNLLAITKRGFILFCKKKEFAEIPDNDVKSYLVVKKNDENFHTFDVSFEWCDDENMKKVVEEKGFGIPLTLFENGIIDKDYVPPVLTLSAYKGLDESYNKEINAEILKIAEEDNNFFSFWVPDKFSHNCSPEKIRLEFIKLLQKLKFSGKKAIAEIGCKWYGKIAQQPYPILHLKEMIDDMKNFCEEVREYFRMRPIELNGNRYVHCSEYDINFDGDRNLFHISSGEFRTGGEFLLLVSKDITNTINTLRVSFCELAIFQKGVNDRTLDFESTTVTLDEKIYRYAFIDTRKDCPDLTISTALELDGHMLIYKLA